MAHNTNALMDEQQQEDLRALEDAMYVLSGKWKIPIMYSMCNGNKRFSDIARSIPGITRSMLSKELRELEMNRLINRTVFPETPVRIEYTYSEYSRSLNSIMRALIVWGKEHREIIKRG